MHETHELAEPRSLLIDERKQFLRVVMLLEDDLNVRPRRRDGEVDGLALAVFVDVAVDDLIRHLAVRQRITGNERRLVRAPDPLHDVAAFGVLRAGTQEDPRKPHRPMPVVEHRFGTTRHHTGPFVALRQPVADLADAVAAALHRHADAARQGSRPLDQVRKAAPMPHVTRALPQVLRDV